jgi:primary-amine oxidase
MSPLVEGFDCNFGATFMNASWHEGNTTVVNANTICMFEADSGFPLSRHKYGGGNGTYPFTALGVVKGSALTTRTIATVGNYVSKQLFHEGRNVTDPIAGLHV